MDSKKILLAAKFHKFVSAEATKNNTFTIYQVPFKLQIKNFVNVWEITFWLTNLANPKPIGQFDSLPKLL